MQATLGAKKSFKEWCGWVFDSIKHDPKLFRLAGSMYMFYLMDIYQHPGDMYYNSMPEEDAQLGRVLGEHLGL